MNAEFCLVQRCQAQTWGDICWPRSKQKLLSCVFSHTELDCSLTRLATLQNITSQPDDITAHACFRKSRLRPASWFVQMVFKSWLKLKTISKFYDDYHVRIVFTELECNRSQDSEVTNKSGNNLYRLMLSRPRKKVLENCSSSIKVRNKDFIKRRWSAGISSLFWQPRLSDRWKLQINRNTTSVTASTSRVLLKSRGKKLTRHWSRMVFFNIVDKHSIYRPKFLFRNSLSDI
jgi:hypothetical protein